MRNRKHYLWITLILILSLFVLYGCGNKTQETFQSKEQASADYKDISADQLKSLMDTDKNLMVVDVREKEEYDSGHINNSILLPTSEIQNRVNELPRDKDIALVCATGSRSSQVAEYLVQLGYPNVYNLDGGISGWTYDLVR